MATTPSPSSHTQRRAVGPEHSTSSAEVVLHAEEGRTVGLADREIIEDTRELCNQLGIKHFTPNLVRWLPIRPAQNCDFGVFDPDEIDIPLSLKNKLGRGELRPLVASSLIYSFTYKRRRASGLLVRLLGSLTLLIPMVIFLAAAFIGTFGEIGSVIAGILAIMFMILSVVLSRWLRGRLLRDERLEADREAARIVGNGPLLQTLQRIDMLGIKNVDRLKEHTWKSRISDNPSISVRIQRLSQGPTRPTINEMVAWQGRSSYHLRYPILSIIFFLSLAAIDPGPIKGQTAAVIGPTFFLLWIAFMCATLVSVYLDRKTKYYIYEYTNHHAQSKPIGTGSGTCPNPEIHPRQTTPCWKRHLRFKGRSFHHLPTHKKSRTSQGGYE